MPEYREPICFARSFTVRGRKVVLTARSDDGEPFDPIDIIRWARRELEEQAYSSGVKSGRYQVESLRDEFANGCTDGHKWRRL